MDLFNMGNNVERFGFESSQTSAFLKLQGMLPVGRFSSITGTLQNDESLTGVHYASGLNSPLLFASNFVTNTNNPYAATGALSELEVSNNDYFKNIQPLYATPFSHGLNIMDKLNDITLPFHTNNLLVSKPLSISSLTGYNFAIGEQISPSAKLNNSLTNPIQWATTYPSSTLSTTSITGADNFSIQGSLNKGYDQLSILGGSSYLSTATAKNDLLTGFNYSGGNLTGSIADLNFRSGSISSIYNPTMNPISAIGSVSFKDNTANNGFHGSFSPIDIIGGRREIASSMFVTQNFIGNGIEGISKYLKSETLGYGLNDFSTAGRDIASGSSIFNNYGRIDNASVLINKVSTEIKRQLSVSSGRILEKMTCEVIDHNGHTTIINVFMHVEINAGDISGGDNQFGLFNIQNIYN